VKPFEKDIAISKQSEESLRMQSAALQAAANAIVITDQSGNILWVNAAFTALAGYTSQEVIGTNPRILKSGKQDDAFYRHLWQTISSGQVWSGEMTNRRKDGSLYADEMTITPLRDPDGVIARYIAIKHDVSGRKRAEEALRQSEEQFRAVFDLAPVGMAQADPRTGQWLRVNKKMCEITGYSSAELLQRRVEDLTHPEDRKSDREAFQRVVRGEAPDYRMEKRCLRKDGALAWMNVNMTVLRDAAGQPTRTVATIEDITGRKRAEESLRLLGSAVEQAEDSIIITDAQLDLSGPRIVFVNPAFTKITGYTAEEVLGKTPRILQGARTDKAVLARLREALARGESFHGETISYRKDGSEFHLEMHITPIRDPNGLVTHFVAIKRDITGRKRAEAALVETSALLETLLQNTPDGIYFKDMQSRFVHFSRKMLEIFHRTHSDELKGRTDFDFFSEEHARPAFEAEQEIIRTGKPILNLEEKEIHLDGRVGWVSTSKLLWRDKAGNVIGTMGISRDITGHKRAEAALVETSALLETLLENTPDNIYFKDMQSRFVHFSRTMLETFHLTHFDELKGRTDFDFFSEEHARPAFEAEQEIIRTGKPILNLEEKEVHLDGRVGWVSTSKLLWRDKAGNVIGTMGISRDITGHKRAEESLRLLGCAVEQANESIVITDAQLDLPGPRIVFVNPACTKMTGYTLAEVLGKTPRILQGARTDKAVLARLRATLARGESFRDELINYRRDRSEFYSEIHIAPIRDPAGNVTHFVAIKRDITERKRLEAHLFQSQKMETVGKLAGGIAHEFNSIMTVIIGQSELMLYDLPAGNPLRKNAAEIHQAADRAAALTRQLLAYGRKQILQPDVLDLNTILAGMESTLRHLAGCDVDVQIAPPTGPRLVKADPGQIEQVIVNIVMNAADAMPHGGKLTLETGETFLDQDYASQFSDLKPGEYVMLAISDTGAGMSEGVKARIFEPFFTTKEVGKGTGLGLATCHGIIKQSDGHISVYSEPGRGATFKIYLPKVRLEKTPPAPPLQSPGLPRGTETILLVEDDPALREMAASLLGRLGYTVLTAGNGLEALNVTHQSATGHIDLLFTDVVMPHMSGKELSDRIHALYPRTKILFTSAYTENAIVHQGVLIPGITLLQKPFTPSSLANKVREVLDKEKSGAASPQ
jgi:PAS domain S-box-containing protein